MLTTRRHLILTGLFAVGAAGSILVAQRAATPPAAAPTTQGRAAGHVTSPKDEWGHNIGDDFFLANYQQLIAYWHKLETDSNRIHLVEIGKTAENRPILMAIITSPANYAKIDRYREISKQLANAETSTGQVLTDDQARALAREGKTVVWIDGGLHATEVLGAQQLLEQVYQMASRTDDETLRFLNDTIELCVLVNPDGMDLVSDAYMKNGSTGTPVLYNHYAGHDDNRDFYMAALPESTAITKIQYREWYPQIVYNHHQTGPQGTVMFAAPFRDPYNYFQHPQAIAAIDTVGSLMQERFMMEGKPGVTTRRGASYSTWFNGGLRTTAHFHNMIGILTETIGNPTPTSVPFLPSKQLGDSNIWMPIKPQDVWHFRQSIEYSITANRAIIDYASRYREKLLFDIYRMGRDEIQWGSEDHWTFTPHKMARVQDELVAKGALPAVQAIPGAASTQQAGGAGGGRGGGGGFGGGGRSGAPATADPLYVAMTTKDMRDPRGFIIPADQPDFYTATQFVNALMKTGITILRATAPFTVNGKPYPANSFVVKTGQAFRPHVMDMFEPQDHPDDIPYPGGPPTAPYDSTGYTLAFTMGVKFDRILDGFDGPLPFVKLTDFAKAPAGAVRPPQAQAPVGYYFTHQANNSFVVINRLLAANEDVSWLWNGPMGYGTFYVALKPTTLPIIQKAAADLGVTFQGTATAPTGPAAKLRRPRIGLVDHYGGGMPTGWTRLILKNLEFPYAEDSENDVFPPDINRGNLRATYDVLVFNNETLGIGGGGGRGGGGGAGGDVPAAGVEQPAAAGQVAGRGGRGGGRGAGSDVVAPGDDRRRPFQPVAEKYTRRQGSISAEGIAALKQFVQDGGTIIAIGSGASSAVQLFGLPLAPHVTVGSATDPQRNHYYVPGSVLTVAVDPKNPVAHGYGDTVDIFFDNSPVWKLNGSSADLRTVAWFPNDHPLRSGWAWGQNYLDKGIEMAEANVGKGRVFLFGNELLFRSQPHGNYKFFFNALYLSVAPEMKAGVGQ